MKVTCKLTHSFTLLIS